MPDNRRPSIPRLGGSLKDVFRERQRPKPPLNVPRKPLPKPLAQLDKAAKTVGRKSGAGAIARVLGSRIGARLLPALAIAITARTVARATQEGIGAYRAHKDLERTAAHVRQQYGTKARAAATRRALRR